MRNHLQYCVTVQAQVRRQEILDCGRSAILIPFLSKPYSRRSLIEYHVILAHKPIAQDNNLVRRIVSADLQAPLVS